MFLCYLKFQVSKFDTRPKFLYDRSSEGVRKLVIS